MKLPSNSLYKETSEKNAPVAVPKLHQSRRFAMLPADILRDRKLTPTAKLAFTGMVMEAYGSGQLAISFTALADLCGAGRRNIILAVKQLVSQRLIELIPNLAEDKQAHRYRLLHPRSRVLAPADGAKKVAPPVLRCAKCRRICKGLAKTAWCRKCTKDVEFDNAVRRKALELLAEKAHSVA